MRWCVIVNRQPVVSDGKVGVVSQQHGISYTLHHTYSIEEARSGFEKNIKTEDLHICWWEVMAPYIIV